MPDSDELDEILKEIKTHKEEDKPSADSNNDTPVREENAEPQEKEDITAKDDTEESTSEQSEEEIAEDNAADTSDETDGGEFTVTEEDAKADAAEEEKQPKVIVEGEGDENVKFESFADYDENSDNGGKKKGNKGVIIAVIVILIIAVIAGVVFAVVKNSEEETTAAVSETEEVTEAVSEVVDAVNPLTGDSDYNSAAVGKRPIAVVVENSEASRPQWGIDDEENPPDIIVEGEVEDGTTRMLWMYADYTSVPLQIGPIRSARPPYIKFSELFDSIFLCWGQSQTKRGTDYVGANTVFRVDEVDHINQMTYSGKVTLFGRDSSRSVSSEHTGVLYGENIADAIEEQGFRTDADDSSYTKFSFLEDAAYDTACDALNVTFSSRIATRSWTYDSSDGKYHCTDYETDVARENLLILFDTTEYISKANYKNSGSAEIYCNYTLAGGAGKLACNGTVIDITWSVEDGLIVLKDTSGNDVSLSVGTTWIGYASSNNGGAVS